MSENMNDNNNVGQFDIKNLNLQEIDELSQQLGEKLRHIVDEACDKANKICNFYGLQVKMQFVLEPKESELTAVQGSEQQNTRE